MTESHNVPWLARGDRTGIGLRPGYKSHDLNGQAMPPPMGGLKRHTPTFNIRPPYVARTSPCPPTSETNKGGGKTKYRLNPILEKQCQACPSTTLGQVTAEKLQVIGKTHRGT